MEASKKQQGLLKVTVHLRRKPGMSEAEWQEHWSDVFAKVAIPVMHKFQVVKYTQYHTPSWTRDLLPSAQKPGEAGAWAMDDFDGHSEIVLRSIEDIKAAVGSREFREQVKPMEDAFLDHAGTVVTVGWEEVYIDEGKVVDRPRRGW